MTKNPAPGVAFSRVALVADKPRWALDAIAHHVKAGIEASSPVRCDILYVEDFRAERDFVRAIRRERFDVVHFFWRRFLIDIFNDHVSAGRQADLEAFLAGTAISFSICDHLYCEPEDILADCHVFHLADGYAPVSESLYKFYSSQLLLPRPTCILRDRTDLVCELAADQRTESADLECDPLRVVWAGNSQWGQWLGLNDSKGLGIITAAIAKARELGCAIQYTEFDSARRTVPNEAVGAAMLAADVLVCASEAEATPLPLLEAMAAGCAVVTTDVGVAREVLPRQQDPLIVARDPDAFASALIRCAGDRAWTRRLGELNRAAVRKWCATSVAEDWMPFFAQVHRSSGQAAKREEKRNIIRSFAPSFLEARLYSLRYSVRRSPFALKIARALAPHLLPALTTVMSLLSRGQKARRLRNFRRMLADKSEHPVGTTLALYAPVWRGVAASTRALIDSAFPVPAFSDQLPSLVSRSEFEEYSAILELLAPRRLIVSGGDRIHRKLAARYKQNHPEARIELIWHGSQVQWSEPSQRELFHMWLDEYRAGTIGKVWVLKRGLDSLLTRQGINAELIENALPQQIRRPKKLNQSGPVKVGLWSPRSDQLKNLITQFLAFAGDERFTVYHLTDDPALLATLDRWLVPHVRLAKGDMPRTQLLNWIGAMDVNLYTSLSECSSMVALESISAGVPVLVGPTTTFFEDDPFLRKFLVTASPDQVSSVRASVEAILKNYDAIAEAIIHLGIRREALLADTRRRLKHGLTVLPGSQPPSSWVALDEQETG